MFTYTWALASSLLNTLNENHEGHSPVVIIAGTIVAMVAIQKACQIYEQWDPQHVKKELTNSGIKWLGKLPYIGSRIKATIDKEVENTLAEIKADVDTARAEWKPIAIMPDKGLSEKVILERFEKVQAHYKPGKLSGGVYAKYDEKRAHLLQTVWSKTALTNPMHTDWPLINLMEAEIISMCQNLLHGKSGAPGLMTHGGSTSILEACKAYVLYARKMGIKQPEIIAPDSAHVAFDKAAKILNVKLIKIPVDKKTGAADAKRMEKAINKNTCLLVGSAPSFPFGIIDPIEALGAIAVKHTIPLHVDACLGGFLNVFAEEAGFKIPPCDFSVPGVTSISFDTHKYGQTVKGNSVLLFSEQCLATPTQVHFDWMGGMYVTPGIDGSRSGADIATTWAVLCHKGKREYVKETKEIFELTQRLVEEIKKIEGVFLPYETQHAVIAIQGKKSVNSLLVADQLRQAGWSVCILQTPEQKPAGFHFCLTTVHVQQEGFLDSFIADLSQAVQYAKANPKEKPKGMAKAYGTLAEGVPAFIQERIGMGYIKILSTLRESTCSVSDASCISTKKERQSEDKLAVLEKQSIQTEEIQGQCNEEAEFLGKGSDSLLSFPRSIN